MVMHDAAIPIPFEWNAAAEAGEPQQQQQQQQTFGTFAFTALSPPPSPDNNNKPIFILFTIDCSGSMYESCGMESSSNKIEQVIATLTSVITLLHEYTSSTSSTPHRHRPITLCFQVFNAIVHSIPFTDTPLHTQSLEASLEVVHELAVHVMGLTDLGVALKTAQTILNQRAQLHPEDELYHILLTDGEITCGTSNMGKLHSYLAAPPAVTTHRHHHLFVGYGDEHDSRLLSMLASMQKGAEYRSVPVMEDAGAVYGEIVHNLLHKIATPICFVMENGEIYDYTCNQWVSFLELDPAMAVYDKPVTLHVRSTDPHNMRLYIQTHSSAAAAATARTTVCCYAEPTRQNLIPYLFRQKTQEYLFAAHELAMAAYNHAATQLTDDDDDFLCSQQQQPDVSISMDNDDDEITRHVVPAPAPVTAPSTPTNCRIRASTNTPPVPPSRKRRHNAIVDNNPPSSPVAATRARTPTAVIAAADTTTTQVPPAVHLATTALKAALKTFHEVLQSYIADNAPTQDTPFMRQLLDDLFIANRTLGTRHAAMLTGARHMSQGRQDAYVAPPLRNRVLATLFADTVADADAFCPSFASPNADASTVINGYSLSTDMSIYSPYCTPAIRTVMANVHNNSISLSGSGRPQNDV